jgi:hypothetical protein
MCCQERTSGCRRSFVEPSALSPVPGPNFDLELGSSDFDLELSSSDLILTVFNRIGTLV